MKDCPPTQAEALEAQVAQLTDELRQARDTNRRLNRRNQDLEQRVRGKHNLAGYWENNWYRGMLDKMAAVKEVKELKAEIKRLKAVTVYKTEQTP